MKKKLAILCIATLCIGSLAGCSQSTSSDASADAVASQEYGVVTSVNGSEIELTLGDISEVDMSDTASGNASGGQPSGDSSGQGQGAPSSDSSTDTSGVTTQSTTSSTDTQDSQQQPSDGGQAPDMASGDAGQSDKGGMSMTMYQFTEGSDTKTITIDDTSILSKSDSGNISGTSGMGGNTLDTLDSSDSSTDSSSSSSSSSGDAEITLSDITEGTILELDYNSDGDLIGVIIRNDVMTEDSMSNGMQNMDGQSSQDMQAPTDSSQGSSDSQSSTDSNSTDL